MQETQNVNNSTRLKVNAYKFLSGILILLSALYAFWSVLELRCEHYAGETPTCRTMFLAWPILYASFIFVYLLFYVIRTRKKKRTLVYDIVIRGLVFIIAIVHTAIAATGGGGGGTIATTTLPSTSTSAALDGGDGS